MSNTATNILDDLRLLEAPGPLAPWQWALLVLLAALLFSLVLWWRRHHQPPAPPSPAEIAAAQEDALAELGKLRALLSPANSRPYAIAVSGVVRRYIERRFGIVAPRRSTEEFLLEARASGTLDERHRTNLSDFLGACDFLKFALASAEGPELEKIHETAVRFVTDTQAPSATTASRQSGGTTA